MAGYTRQSLAQILNGEIVSAPPLNAEFNQILAAFNNSTGHKHDGTAAEGPPIDRIADADQNNLVFVDTSANQINFYVESSAAQVGQISIQDGAIVPFTDNDIDLGSSSFEFKDLYIDGTANIDSLVADTADINGGNIDGTTIGASTPAAATFTDLTVSTGSTIDFSGATVSNGGTFTTVTISGGSITGITDLAIADGGTGASTASVARTNLGLAIGTNVQAYDAGLQSISGLSTSSNQMIYTTGADTYATTSLTSAGRALLDDADASAQRTTLGLGTLATQNANSVAITGGTISGISNLSDPGTSLQYTFSTTTTDSDPGSGLVRLNNATQNAATEIYIDDEDSDGTDVSGVIGLLSGGNNPSSVLGYVTIRKEFAPENFITMKITTLTSASGYTKLVGTVEASSGATPFSDTDNLYFSIDVSGDKGDPGDLSGPASSTDNAIVRWDGTSGSLVQDSSVVIDDSGSVYIATASPLLGVGYSNLSTGSAKVEIGTGRTDDGPSYIDLVGDTTYTDYGARFIRNSGANGTTELAHQGTGAFRLRGLAASPVTIETSNAERLRITSSGQLVVGATSADASLVFSVDGDAQFGNSIDGVVISNGTGNPAIGNTSYLRRNSSTGDFSIYAGTSIARNLIFFTENGSERLRIDSSGNVGIGTSSPTSKLTVDAGADGGIYVNKTSTYDYFFQAEANLGVNNNRTYTLAPPSTDSITEPFIWSTGNAHAWNVDGQEIMRIDSSGKVGIGTSSPSALLDVAGTAVAREGMPLITDATTTRTLALADNGGYIRFTSGSATTCTVPLNSSVAFPTGAEIVLFQAGAGQVTLAATGGVTINSKSGNLKITGQYSSATLKKVATDTWDLIGDLSA